MTNKKIELKEVVEAKKYLKSVIKPNSELLVNIASVSASGMTRKMSVYVVGKVNRWEYKKDGTSKMVARYDLIFLNHYLEKAGLITKDKNGYAIVRGCGMDMAFSLIYDIKIGLFGYEKAISNQQFRVI